VADAPYMPPPMEVAPPPPSSDNVAVCGCCLSVHGRSTGVLAGVCPYIAGGDANPEAAVMVPCPWNAAAGAAVAWAGVGLDMATGAAKLLVVVWWWCCCCCSGCPYPVGAGAGGRGKALPAKGSYVTYRRADVTRGFTAAMPPAKGLVPLFNEGGADDHPAEAAAEPAVAPLAEFKSKPTPLPDLGGGGK
jgi:hypothetical protein